jgi:hypothetical protein
MVCHVPSALCFGSRSVNKRIILQLIVTHRKITSEGKNNSVMLALGKEETYIR